MLSKSDPQCIVYIKRKPQQYTAQIQSVHDMPWVELGRTEVIQDDLNPNFAQAMLVDYYFEETQPIKYDQSLESITRCLSS